MPRNVIPKKMNDNQKLQTLAGALEAAEVVKLRDVRLPEFDKNRQIDEQTALVFDFKCRYDIIFGTDFLSKAGININYETGVIEWFRYILPLRDPDTLDSETFKDMEDSMSIQVEDNIFGVDWLDGFGTETLDAKYDVTNAREVAEKQAHLTTQKTTGLTPLV